MSIIKVGKWFATGFSFGRIPYDTLVLFFSKGDLEWMNTLSSLGISRQPCCLLQLPLSFIFIGRRNKMKTYRFTQNNSGGYLIGPYEFIVEALSLDDAWTKLHEQSWFDPNYCDCCGPRWCKSNASVYSNGEWDFDIWKEIDNGN